MNVEIGAEAALFPEKEYINGIAVAVHSKTHTIKRKHLKLRLHNTIWLADKSLFTLEKITPPPSRPS
jgi:hypothetical protein